MFTSTYAWGGPQVGEVKQKMGTTWVERDFENITINDPEFPLYMDDFLQTGEDGAMNIEFVDGTKVTVAPNSEMVIDEFAFDTTAVPIEVALAIAVNVGTFTYESGSISKLGGEVAMVTPSAVITVQGTAFSGTVDPNGKTTITLLPDSNGNVGQVTVKNDAGSSMISTAYSSVTVLSDNLMPSPPSPLDNNAKQELFDLDTNEEVIEEFEEQSNPTKVKKIENLNEEVEIDSELVQDEQVEVKDKELVQDEQVDDAKEIEQIEQKEETKELIQEEQKEEVIEFETQEEVKVELDTFEQNDEVLDKIEIIEVETKDFNVEVTDEVASDLEESLINDKATIDSDVNFDIKGDDQVLDTTDIVEIIMTNEDFITSDTVQTKAVTEDIIVDDSIDTEVDTSYYDQWDDEAYDDEYGWVDENDQVTVWDASGEVKMDYEDSKKMWAEMDQAYYDAIGCENNCDWESIDWNDVDWDSVDWDALYEQQDATMAKYGLDTDWKDYSEDWETDDSIDVTDDVFDDVEKFEGDVTEDTTLDVWADDDQEIFVDEGVVEYEEAYNDYYSQDGPQLLTGNEDWCDPSWCTQQYIDETNEWIQMDWDLNTKYDSWTKESKQLFKDLYLNPQWYGDTKDAPKPWTISEIKNKYITEWGWEEWDIYWEAFWEWEQQGTYDNWEAEYEELSIEEEYSFETTEIDEWEIEYLASLDTEPDCIYMGYYWDKANQSCGTEWVDNSGATTLVTASGETINYETGDITQTVTTTAGDGSSSSVTQTGRYSTYGNTGNVDAYAGENGYKRIDRTYSNHRAYITTNSIENFDVMIIQEEETQATTAGTAGSRATITIIQIK